MMTAVMSAFNGVLLSVIAHLGRDGGLEHCGKSNGDSREPKSAPTTVFRRIFGYGNAAAGFCGRARDLHGRAGVAGAPMSGPTHSGNLHIDPLAASTGTTPFPPKRADSAGSGTRLKPCSGVSQLFATQRLPAGSTATSVMICNPPM